MPTPSPQNSRGRSYLQRLAWWVDGDLARLSPGNRTRLVAWQETRTRVALGHLFTLLVLVAAGKVALVLAGAWPTALPAWTYALAMGVLLLGRVGYHFARRLVTEGLSATAFLAGLVAILMDPARSWAENPGLALGWVWLLAALGTPVLARLRSVVVFGALLVVAIAVFFAYVPLSASERPSILLYFVASFAGGMLLRRSRSDLTLDFRRTTDAAWETANTDQLTSLLNRRGWREQAPLLLEECEEVQRPISLLFIDLDHFKQLNDLKGHSAGDAALIRVGAVLKARVADGLAARLGGEEFVCLLPGMDAFAASAFAESLAEALRMDGEPALTFSGGIAQRRAGESLKDLLARGDAAMYRAKEAGRDAVHVG